MHTLKLTTQTLKRTAVRTAVMLTILVFAMAGTLRADDIVTHWNKVMLATMAAGGTNPLVSTRVAAIGKPCVRLVNGIQHKYKPFHADIPAPRGASVPAAVIESAYATFGPCTDGSDVERQASLAKLHASSRSSALGSSSATW